MKTTLTLSAVLFTLTLAPATFANGAREQTQASPASPPVAASHDESPNDFATITRKVLQGLDLELRAQLLSGLRENGLRLLQAASPVLIDGAGSAVREVTAR